MKTGNPKNSLVMRGLLGVALALMLQPTPGARAQEGIKVHGDWTIEVRNADGSLTSRREFHNALMDSGGTQLAALLSRAGSAGRWMVALFAGHANSPRPCPGGPFGSDTCEIVEGGSAPPYDNPSASVFPNLTVTRTGVMLHKVLLTGTATAAQAGDIAVVRTTLGFCSHKTTPENCTAAGSSTSGLVITQAILNPTNPVKQGQIIQVTVTLSFS